MKVYVARKGFDLEGFEPIGVAKTEKVAQKIIDNDDCPPCLEPIYDIEEFELKE